MVVHPYCGIYYSEITVDTQNNFVDLKGSMLNEKKLISRVAYSVIPFI